MHFYKKTFKKDNNLYYFGSLITSFLLLFAIFNPSYANKINANTANYESALEQSDSSEIIEFSNSVFESIQFEKKSGKIILIALADFKEDLQQSKTMQLISNSNNTVIEYKNTIDSLKEHEFSQYKIIEVNDNTKKLIFSALTKDYLKELTYTIYDNSYLIEVVQSVKNLKDHEIDVIFTHGLSLINKDKNLPDKELSLYSEKDKKVAKSVSYFNENPVIKSNTSWFGIHDKYFITALIPNEQLLFSSNSYEQTKVPTSFRLIKPVNKLAASSTTEIKSFLYAGPIDKHSMYKNCYLLPIFQSSKKSYEAFESTVYTGFFPSVYNVVFSIMKLIQSFVKNWGITIILITLLFKIISLPILILMRINQKKMMESKHLFEAIERRYRNTDQLNQKMIEGYRQIGINPAVTILLLVLQFMQLPILYSLYYIINNNISFRHAPFILWIKDLSAQDPYWLLPALCCLSILFYSYLQLKYLSQEGDSSSQQNLMIKIFTVLTIGLTLISPSGLVIYWFTSNIFNIIYTLISNSAL